MLFGLVTGNLDYMRSIVGWGYDYVEIMGAALLPLEGEAAWHPRRRQIEDTGAPVTNLAGFIGGEARFVGPGHDWHRTRAYIETVVGRGAELGVDTFNWGSPMSKSVPPGWPISKAFEQIERAAHVIADAVRRHRAICVIEPINPGECNVTYYVTDGAMIARSIERPEIRCLADFFHMSLQAESLAHIDSCREVIAHTHTSGPRRLFPLDGQSWSQRDFFGALRRIAYDRRVSIESWTTRPNSTFSQDAAASVAYLRWLHADVASGPLPEPPAESDYQWWPP